MCSTVRSVEFVSVEFCCRGRFFVRFGLVLHELTPASFAFLTIQKGRQSSHVCATLTTFRKRLVKRDHFNWLCVVLFAKKMFTTFLFALHWFLHCVLGCSTLRKGQVIVSDTQLAINAIKSPATYIIMIKY